MGASASLASKSIPKSSGDLHKKNVLEYVIENHKMKSSLKIENIWSVRSSACKIEKELFDDLHFSPFVISTVSGV